MKNKLPTAEEMNAAAEKFWAEETAEFQKNISNRPHDAVIAARQEAELVDRLSFALGPEAFDKAISASVSMEKRVADLAEAHAAARKRTSSNGGKVAAQNAKAEVAAAHEKWVAAAQALLSQGKPRRSINSILAERFKVDRRTIGRALKNRA